MAEMLRRTLLLLLAFAPVPASAFDGFLWRNTGDTLYAFSWEFANPVKDLQSQFASKLSRSGLQLEFRSGLGAHFTAGVAASWNHFHDRVDDLAHDMNQVSVRATAHVYLGSGRVQPYVGAGAGGIWREVAVEGFKSTRGVGVCADPEAGILLSLSTGFALNLMARYEFTNASFQVPGSPGVRVASPRWFGVSAGIAFY